MQIRHSSLRYFLAPFGGLLLFFSSPLFSQESNDPSKVYCHQLFYSWVAKLPEKQKDEFLRHIKSLARAIPEIKGVKVATIVSSSEAFDFTVILTFDRPEDIEAYQDHPEHNILVEMAEKCIGSYSYFRYWK